MTPGEASAVDDAVDRVVHTRFGTFAVDPGAVVRFPAGLPGFEACRQFVVLSSPELAPFSCLHAVVGPAASFLVVDPRLALADYRCALGAADLARLDASEATVLLWLAIVSMGDDGQACVNLRAPIVVNPERMLGYQLMPHNSLYPVRHPLAAA